MYVEKREIYIAEDGKEFLTLMECEEYEQLQADRIKLVEAAKAIKEYCKSQINCLDCIFKDEEEGFCIVGDEYSSCPDGWVV